MDSKLNNNEMPQELENKDIVQGTDQSLDRFTEFETKYRVDGKLEQPFKNLVMSLEKDLGKWDFTYAEGPDHYYTKSDGSFGRYRKAINQKMSWWTMKEKPLGAKHNVKRKEVNWRVDGTTFETIEAGALMQGYDFNFKIWKSCHIYKFKETTFVFYRVTDDYNNQDHFIEIELDEDTIHNLTENEAWDKIRKYEKMLESLGISHRNRITKSLFEMYKKDIYGKEKEKTL